MPARPVSQLPAPALRAALELARAATSPAAVSAGSIQQAAVDFGAPASKPPNFPPAAIHVADLADAAGYSPHHFSRMFSATMGISPAQYVGALRIDTAKRLLLSTDLPVIDIATAIGFDSLSSFARRFRESVGIPPAGLRGLADSVAATTLTPFSIYRGLSAPDSEALVRLRFPVPDPAFGPAEPRATWLGWFSHPYPVGMPTAGTLTWKDELALPLCPGSTWLLAYSVPITEEAADVLAPTRPLVAIGSGPIFSPGHPVELELRRAEEFSVPMLPALPNLRSGATH